MVTIEKIIYNGWKDCIRIDNGEIELIVTTAIGPRVIRYGFIGKENELCEKPEQAGLTSADEWTMFGGHRLWHSPEDEKRTYYNDTDPVDYEIIDNGVLLSQITEPITGIKKSITLTMDESGKVTLKHEMSNTNLWAVDLSLWAITVMAAGGLQVMQNPNRETGLLPNRSLTLWPYSKMNDSRVTWGDKYIFLQQDSKCDGPFKLGFPNEHEFSAYFNHGNLFIKRHIHDQNATYPDCNSSYETYTCDFMTEMESLSPLYKIEPNATKEHFEFWELHAGIAKPSTEAAVEKALASFVG